MGMHFGVLVAEMRWPELLRHLEARTGRFVDQGEVEDSDRIDWLRADDLVLLAGDLEGKAYLADSSHLLSGGDPDLVADLAADSGTLMIGCGAETASGSYYFIAGRGRELLRHYYHCRMDLARPYERGQPLPTEEAYPFNGDLYGVGLKEGLRHFGFDFDRWYEQGQRRALLYIDDQLMRELPWPLTLGPLTLTLEQHRAQWQLPPGQRPRPTVVVSSVLPGRQVSPPFDRGGPAASSSSSAALPRIRVSRVSSVEASENWFGRIVGRVREWFGW